MTRKFVQPGEVKEYTNTSGSTITAGSVVKMSHTLGVALVDIANNASGSVKVTGVFKDLPKVSAAVFAVGEKLLWDASAGAFDDSSATPASGDVMGAAVAWVAGANAETTCTVLLTPGNATLS